MKADIEHTPRLEGSPNGSSGTWGVLYAAGDLTLPCFRCRRGARAVPTCVPSHVSEGFPTVETSAQLHRMMQARLLIKVASNEEQRGEDL